jgi:hypothetical protein
MQAEFDETWFYVYSGRDPMSSDPEQEPNDPFAVVRAVRLDMITGWENDMKHFEIRIYAKGNPPIVCTFGYGGCHTINIHGAFLMVLQKALNLHIPRVWDLGTGIGLVKRDIEVSNAMTRRQCAAESD